MKEYTDESWSEVLKSLGCKSSREACAFGIKFGEYVGGETFRKYHISNVCVYGGTSSFYVKWTDNGKGKTYFDGPFHAADRSGMEAMAIGVIVATSASFRRLLA